MARGYPDFFGFSVFPFHGISYRAEHPAAAVAAGAETTLIEIAGKGILFSGYVVVSGVAAINARSLIYVDGNRISEQTPHNALLTNTASGYPDLQVISEYDVISNHYTLLMIKEITFGYQFKLTISDVDVLGPTVTAGIRYNLIQ